MIRKDRLRKERMSNSKKTPTGMHHKLNDNSFEHFEIVNFSLIILLGRKRGSDNPYDQNFTKHSPFTLRHAPIISKTVEKHGMY